MQILEDTNQLKNKISMKNKFFILLILIFSFYQVKGQDTKPNILLITLDDMNWDSPAVTGGIIPDLTPNIDAIAKNGVLFENAYVQAPNCSPSRVVIQTGLYPHQSGMRGFFYAKDNSNTLSELLKKNGYFTGVINKAADTNLSPNSKKYWDVNSSMGKMKKRSAKAYGDLLETFVKKSTKKDKPFYCVVNIADPHKPFFNDSQSKKAGFDEFKPSKIYDLSAVQVPKFLPKNEIIKQEVLNYYNSVKRGDDCVGEILKIIDSYKLAKNTIVILLSDHGMPFPFAKSSVYPNGVKTPLIFSWDKKYKPTIDKNSMVSAIDLAPTILDILGLPIPKSMVGQSIKPVLNKEKNEVGEFVFAQFDENAGGLPSPSRTIISKKFGYVFNPWATGNHLFKSAASYHATYKQMVKISKENMTVKERFDFWKYRTIEELYDYENDPDALNNLINDPKYKAILDQLRNKLMIQMQTTNDYVLNAFKNKNDVVFLNNWMTAQKQEAKTRRETIKWKRSKNSSGNTKNNTKLFVNNK